MLRVRICLRPMTVVVPAAEVCSLEFLSFEFVEDFGFRISTFLFLVAAAGRIKRTWP